MKLKLGHFLLSYLIIAIFVLSACSSRLNPSINLTPSPTFISPTPAIVTQNLNFTPTLNQIDLYIAMLTTTPTAPPLPTLPSDCGVVKLGNVGTQTIDNTQNILVNGTAILCGQIYVSIVGSTITATIQEGLLDLDTGTFNIEEADFWFCPGGGSTIFYYLCNFNNSEVKKYQFIFESGKLLEPKQPSFEECSGTEPYAGVNDNEAKYACVVTTLGNISRIKVEQFNPLDSVMSIEISFITWEK